MLRSTALLILPALPILLGAAASMAAELPAPLAADLAQLASPERAVGFAARSDAARRGLAHIMEGRALGGPFPLDLYRLIRPDVDAATRWRTEGTLPSPFAAGAGLGESVFEGERGIRLVSKTCFECHAGTAAGYTIAGAGNAHLDVVPLVAAADRLLAWDFTRDIEKQAARGADASRPARDLWSPSQLPALYRYVRDYKNYVRDFLLPPYRFASARGDNLGPYGVWLMAGNMADPEHTGVIPGAPDDPRTAHERSLLASLAYQTVDPQPWWTARFKARAYWFWDSPGHAARDFHLNFYYPQKSVDSADTLDQHRAKFRAHLDTISEVMDYVREVPVPPLPPGQEADLRARWTSVERGDQIFHGGPNSTGQPMACSGCHGQYHRTARGLEVSYANAGLIDVGTDRAYNDLMRRLAPIVARTARTRAVYGADAPDYHPLTQPGYTPPVLVGLWASAPYLHNGSVPTLSDFFRAPAQRPPIWGRNVDRPLSYDAVRVGLDREEVTPETLEVKRRAAAGCAADHPAALEHRRFYDTREPGRSNQGHPFGTDLSDAEKNALVDFLHALAPAPGESVIVPGTTPTPR